MIKIKPDKLAKFSKWVLFGYSITTCSRFLVDTYSDYLIWAEIRVEPQKNSKIISEVIKGLEIDLNKIFDFRGLE
ncbi:MAG: hypothetical protein FWH18_08430 [Marinilabiliaceae bacterium]|nr:hypothetical protein [Marinilabiliaceae bacterium]